jgi:hypothetical protein
VLARLAAASCVEPNAHEDRIVRKLNLIQAIPENVMSETQPALLTQKKADYVFPALGIATLALGFYQGFVRGSGSVLVFILLGGSIVFFAIALYPLLKRCGDQIAVAFSAVLHWAIKVEARPATKPGTRPEKKSAIENLMDARLGDLCSADCLNDPEGAGRIVAQAIVRAQAAIATTTTSQPDVELQLETKPINEGALSLPAGMSPVEIAGPESATLGKLKNG